MERGRESYIRMVVAHAFIAHPMGEGIMCSRGERGYTRSPEINTGSLPLVLSASCEPPFLARLRQSFVVSLVGSELTEMYKLAPPGLAKIHTWKTC